MLIRERLYLVPLWSSVMLGEFNNYEEIQVKRLTNNIVELYFNHLKNARLKKKVACSQLAALQFDEISAKHSLFFEKSGEDPKSWIPKPNPKRFYINLLVILVYYNINTFYLFKKQEKN